MPPGPLNNKLLLAGIAGVAILLGIAGTALRSGRLTGQAGGGWCCPVSGYGNCLQWASAADCGDDSPNPDDDGNPSDGYVYTADQVQCDVACGGHAQNPEPKADLAVGIACLCMGSLDQAHRCTITVKNNGPNAAANVAVTFSVSGDLQVPSQPPLGALTGSASATIALRSQSPDAVVWSGGTLALNAGVRRTITLASGPLESGDGTAAIAATSTTTDPNSANNEPAYVSLDPIDTCMCGNGIADGPELCDEGSVCYRVDPQTENRVTATPPVECTGNPSVCGGQFPECGPIARNGCGQECTCCARQGVGAGLWAMQHGDPHFVTMNGRVFDEFTPFATYHVFRDPGKGNDYLDIWTYGQPTGVTPTTTRGAWVYINGGWRYVAPGANFVPRLENREYVLDFAEGGFGGPDYAGLRHIDLKITVKPGGFLQDGRWPRGLLALVGTDPVTGTAVNPVTGACLPNPAPACYTAVDEADLVENFDDFDEANELCLPEGSPSWAAPPPPIAGAPAGGMPLLTCAQASSASSAAEARPPMACADTVDNDGDGKTDSADPGCHLDGYANNALTYDRLDNSETDGQTLSAPLAFAACTADGGLVAHYTFDDVSGTTVPDSSGNGNDGQLKGVTAFQDCMDFRGGGYISAPDDPTMDNEFGLTIAAWVKQRTLRNGYIVSKNQPGNAASNHHYGLLIRGPENSQPSTNGKPAFANHPASMTGYNTADAATAIPVDAWKHLAVTVDTLNQQVKFFVNGQLDATRPWTHGLPANSQPLLIGWGEPDNASYSKKFDGLMDDVRIYSRPLQSTEVAALAQIAPSCATSAESDLIAHYTFDDVSGTTVPDSSGFDRHGTAGGGPQVVPGGCMYFDGVDDHVSIPNFDRQVFTFATWAKREDGGFRTPPLIISHGNGGWNVIYLDPDGPRNPDLHYNSTQGSQFVALNQTAGAQWAATNSRVASDSFRHIAVTYDGAMAKLYIDGNLDATRTFNQTFLSAGSAMYHLGGRAVTLAEGSTWFKGFMDDTRIYGRVLTAPEIADIMGSAPSCEDSTVSSTHLACSGNQCVTVQGAGVNQCNADADCSGTSQHNGCSSNSCTLIDGAGISQCTVSPNNCGSGQTHLACVGLACQSVPGAGANTCTNDATCTAAADQHLACAGNQCVIVDGAGANTCNANNDCAGSTSSNASPEPQIRLDCGCDHNSASGKETICYLQVLNPSTSNMNNLAVSASVPLSQPGNPSFAYLQLFGQTGQAMFVRQCFDFWGGNSLSEMIGGVSVNCDHPNSAVFCRQLLWDSAAAPPAEKLPRRSGAQAGTGPGQCVVSPQPNSPGRPPAALHDASLASTYFGLSDRNLNGDPVTTPVSITVNWKDDAGNAHSTVKSFTVDYPPPQPSPFPIAEKDWRAYCDYVSSSVSSSSSSSSTSVAGQLCGNRRIDGLEECDDGNRVDGDGCDKNCLLEGNICNL